MVSSGGAIVEAAALTNGQLLIGSSGAAPVAASLTGTTNQVNITTGAGSITIALPQNINTAATPTFASETLTAVTNQLVLGTTNTTTISSVAPAASRTYTIADAGGADTFTMLAATQTLTNKTLTNANNFFADGTTPTKKIGFLSSGATTATTLTLASITTANRTITFPDATDTVVTLAATQTLTNKTLTNANNFFADGTTPSKKIGFLSSGATATTTLTLASVTSSNRTITFPDITDTVVTLNAVQSLASKTMTDGTSNVTAKGLFSATTTVAVSTATAPTAGQVLTATSSVAATWQSYTGFTPVYANYYATAAQTISASTGVGFANSDATSAGISSSGTSNTSFTINTTGTYLIHFGIWSTVGASAYYYCTQNGTTIASSTVSQQDMNSMTTSAFIHAFTAADTLKVLASASTTNSAPAAGANSAYITFLRVA
jgi:multisubunit Na+/H+ antiporter MnhF subunit